MVRKRVIVVTGGGSGMGRAIARRFAKAGDKVFILGRREEKLKETAEGFAGIECIVTDVTNTASIERARAIITKNHQNIDVLINNAGGTVSVSPDATLEESAKAWQHVIDTNLSSVFYMVFAFEKHLTRPGGRIINISSVAALAGSSMGGVSGQVYAASKAGIHGLSRTLTKTLSPDGITVNCVAPGVIDDTEFFGSEGMTDDRKAKYLAAIPLGRLGKSEEVAAAVYYLASEKAGFITGEILNINGGAQFGR